jgi:hypothetical protein
MINGGIRSIVDGLAIIGLGIFTILKGVLTVLADSVINTGLLFTIPYNLFFWIIALPTRYLPRLCPPETS